jgi:single-strand DNA-binding protein
VNATEITVVGHVADSPRRVRLQSGMVTNFRLAATERRFDRERQEWVDGGTFWSDVECFGDLGGNVSHTLSKGDPVIVVGSVTTRQWESENGRGSVSQIRAGAVGPNLARGTATFTKNQRPASAQPEESASPTDQAAAEETAPQQTAPEQAAPELQRGVDYEAAPEALYGVNSEDSVPEPALR